MNKSELGLDRFLSIVNHQNDLLSLYLRALPFFLYKCGIDKLVFFKYSRRKKCYDIKIGLDKGDFYSITQSRFEDYDIKSLFDSDFNMKVRSFGSSCNDVIRSFVSIYIDGSIKRVKKEDLPFSKLKKMFDDFGFNGPVLLMPFKSRREIMGFMLLYPSCDAKEIESYVEAFGCALDKLKLSKYSENLEQLLLSYEVAKSNDHDRIYQLGKATTIIAHEIKNALVGIIGLFGKIGNYVQKDEKAGKYYNLIESQLKRLYNFVVDVNNFSKLKDTINLSDVNISDVIDDAIEMVSAFYKNVTFSVSLNKGNYVLMADKEQLQQVFLNLFKNSIEANSKGEIRIDVSAKEEEGFLVIKIKDNSGGLEEEKLKKIAEPFFTTKHYGTGLGLSIVYNIIEKHNGFIKFVNVPGGLECIIKLPINLTEVENE